MIDQQTFWGENFYNHPPLTEEMVEIAESSLNIRLPKAYTDILRIQNGGYTREFSFPMKKETSWAPDHVFLDHLFGIVIAPDHETAFNLLSTEYMTKEWDLPKRLALLAGDGHWWIALDYRKRDEPTVVWIDTELDQDIQMANSFGNFLDGLEEFEST